jgi:glycosyltransferase involved in cell wall biosynthesis
MPKVILVSPVAESGGLSRFAKDLLGSSTGKDIHLYNVYRPAKSTTVRGAYGYRTLISAGWKPALKNIYLTLKMFLLFPFALIYSKANIVHIASSSYWSFWENVVYLCLSKILARKVVFHFLGDFHLFFKASNFFVKFLILTCFNWSDSIIVLTDSIKNILSSKIKPEKILVIPSFIDSSLPVFSSKNNHKPDGAFRLLFFGGNSGIRKGITDIAAAIPYVTEIIPSIRFLLCGGSDVKRTYDNLPERCKQNVDYLGSIAESEIYHLLEMVNAYILPSYSEGVPYSIIEAMAAGLPIISTNVGGIPEIVVPQENGILINPGDVIGLQNAIFQLANDSTLSQKMEENNRKKARDQFASGKALLQIADLYGALLNS